MKILTPDEFYTSAAETDLFEQVTSEIIEEDKKDPVDQTALRCARDWSVLANQVVGAEQF